MLIIIDLAFSSSGLLMGSNVIDTDAPCADPTSSVVPQPLTWTCAQYLAWLNDNPQVHAQAGWDVTTKLPAVTQGMTRWGALVQQCNSASAPAELQALKLAVPVVTQPPVVTGA